MKITLHYFTDSIIHQKRETVNCFFVFSGLFQYFRDNVQNFDAIIAQFEQMNRAVSVKKSLIREKSSKIRKSLYNHRDLWYNR